MGDAQYYLSESGGTVWVLQLNNVEWISVALGCGLVLLDYWWLGDFAWWW